MYLLTKKLNVADRIRAKMVAVKMPARSYKKYKTVINPVRVMSVQKESI